MAMVELDLHSCKLSVYMDLIDIINLTLSSTRLDAMGSAREGIGPSGVCDAEREHCVLVRKEKRDPVARGRVCCDMNNNYRTLVELPLSANSRH